MAARPKATPTTGVTAVPRESPASPESSASPASPALDYRVAFDRAPIGLVLSRQRQIVDCNQRVLQMFGAERDALLGRSFELLYPTPAEFERTGVRIAASLDASGRYADERVMRRLGGPARGELFWCHVSGRTLDTTDPHAAGIWSFEDLSAQRPIGVALTPREREIAALLIEGLTSKLIGKRLTISPRTVDVYRARLMKKHVAGSTAQLVQRLLRA